MKTEQQVTYKKQTFNVIITKKASCDGCHFLTECDDPVSRPCGKSPLDPKFPECLAEFSPDKTNKIFTLVTEPLTTLP